MLVHQRKKLLIPIITAMTISLVACQDPVPPPILPTPMETSGPVITNPSAELTLKIKGDQALQNFIISQAKGLCLNDIAALKTQIKLPAPFDESKKSLLLLKGISIEGDLLTTRSNITDLAVLLAGLEISLPNVPTGEIKATTYLLDQSDHILGTLKYELELKGESGTVSILLKPVEQQSSEPNCPFITADIEGAVLTEASEGILLPIKPEILEEEIEPSPSPSPSPSPEPTPTPTPSPTPFPEVDLVQAPEDLKIVSRSTETLTAFWTFKEEDPHTYTLYLDGKVFKKGLEVNNFTFGGLEANTEYTIEVQTITAEGESEKVNITTTTTSSGKEGTGNFGGGGDIAPEATPSPTPTPSISPTPVPTPSPIGEFQVSDETNFPQIRSDAASDDSGNFMVVWDSDNQDGSGKGIYGQRYDVSGTPLGSEFQINQVTAGEQYNPSVAMDSDGDFVVTWTGQDDDDKGIFARRFMADGTPDGGEFQVNVTTDGVQDNSDVATDDLGNFVVTWSGDYYYGGEEIYGRKYTATGTPLTSEFSVFSSSDTSINSSSVAMDNDGDFVVAYKSEAYGTPSIQAQRYNAAAAPQGGSVEVTDNYTVTSLGDPSVALEDNGKFIVTWQDSGHLDSSDTGIYARRYDSGNSPLGAEFQVNTNMNDRQDLPVVALNDNGNFVVSWQSANQDGSGRGIYAQRFDSDGSALGTEFLVNTTTSADQRRPDVSYIGNNKFLITWEMPDGSNFGVYAQLYNSDGTPL